MLTVADLEPGAALHLLQSRPGLGYRIGPFTKTLHTDIESLQKLFVSLFDRYKTFDTTEDFVDCPLVVKRKSGLGRFLRPQVEFTTGGSQPFPPHAYEHALPMLEWGSNWCVAQSANSYLLLHAGVVATAADEGIIFPAAPQSGKSTLCAALDQHGWRLLADEFTIVDLSDAKVLPYPRLIPLKNESPGIIEQLFPEAELGPRIHNTRKGTLAHYKPTRASIERDQDRATPRWVVFPRFGAENKTNLRPMSPEQAFMRITTNSFNYHVLGELSFDAVDNIVSTCDVFDFPFNSLDSAVRALEELTAQ
jgi:HprK-related kinase A